MLAMVRITVGMSIVRVSEISQLCFSTLSTEHGGLSGTERRENWCETYSRISFSYHLRFPFF